jgi:homoserine kinase
MYSAEPVTVAVPATSANLGPGFDSLGLALGLFDHVTAQATGSAIRVEVAGEGAGEVPADGTHLIISTMWQTFAQLGLAPPDGLTLTCQNRIPHARGLGSSSAAIVAGVLLARALAGQPRDDAWSLRLAARIEGHPDNVAPCLLGGFTIAWTGDGEAGDGEAGAVRLLPHPDLRPTVYIPTTHGLTAHARAALPEWVPHADAAFNAARAALLVHALTGAPDLLLIATEDRLHQPYRSSGMPETAALVARLRDSNVPAFVSGAGPTVLALPVSTAPEAPEGWRAESLSVDLDGGRILRSGHAEGDPVAAGLPS